MTCCRLNKYQASLYDVDALAWSMQGLHHVSELVQAAVRGSTGGSDGSPALQGSSLVAAELAMLSLQPQAEDDVPLDESRHPPLPHLDDQQQAAADSAPGEGQGGGHAGSHAAKQDAAAAAATQSAHEAAAGGAHDAEEQELAAAAAAAGVSGARDAARSAFLLAALTPLAAEVPGLQPASVATQLQLLRMAAGLEVVEARLALADRHILGRGGLSGPNCQVGRRG
jgi:hypothetical protein